MTAPRRSRRRRPRPPAPRWTVGVDVGGTWVRVLAQGETGRPRAVAVSAGRGGTAEALMRAWRRLGLVRSAVRVLVVASRGVWTPRERAAASRRLGDLARRVRVISDVEAAHLGALGGAPGILVLAGTGSIALGRDARGRWARAGGLGPLLGDAGSAFAIGRDWLVAQATAGDAARARALAVAPDAVARIAALAPAVLVRARRGDLSARGAVASAQVAMADLTVQVARRLRLPRPAPASWAGGLMHEAGFRAGVWRAVRRAGLPVTPRAPRASPLEAAAALARDLAGASWTAAPALMGARGASSRALASRRPRTSTRRTR